MFVMWFGAAAPTFAPDYFLLFSEKLPWEARLDSTIEFLKKCNLVCSYMFLPDDTAHYYGPFSKETMASVEKVDKTMGELLKRLEKEGLNDVDIIIVSDHGMAEIDNTKGDHEIDLSKLSDLSKYKLHGSSPVWNIWTKPGKQEEVYRELKSLSKKFPFRVWLRDEIPAEYHYR